MGVSGILLTLGTLSQAQLGLAFAPEQLCLYLLLATAGSAAFAVYLRHLRKGNAQPALR